MVETSRGTLAIGEGGRSGIEAHVELDGAISWSDGTGVGSFDAKESSIGGPSIETGDFSDVGGNVDAGRIGGEAIDRTHVHLDTCGGLGTRGAGICDDTSDLSIATESRETDEGSDLGVGRVENAGAVVDGC